MRNDTFRRRVPIRPCLTVSAAVVLAPTPVDELCSPHPMTIHLSVTVRIYYYYVAPHNRVAHLTHLVDGSAPRFIGLSLYEDRILWMGRFLEPSFPIVNSSFFEQMAAIFTSFWQQQRRSMVGLAPVRRAGKAAWAVAISPAATHRRRCHRVTELNFPTLS